MEGNGEAPRVARESSSHRQGSVLARFGLLMMLISYEGWGVHHSCDSVPSVSVSVSSPTQARTGREKRQYYKSQRIRPPNLMFIRNGERAWSGR